MSDGKKARQQTLKKEGFLSGIGIHTGQKCVLFFKPAPVNHGICFMKQGCVIDFKSFPEEAQWEENGESLRSTTVGSGEHKIRTTEHLLAALVGLGVHNLDIEVEGSEIPALDGSAEPFVSFFKQLGLKAQDADVENFSLKEPIFCYEPGKAIAAFPANQLKVAYVLDHAHPLLGTQKADFLMSAETFESEIAPARTFCTQEEGEAARRRGFGGGANFENTLVLSKDGPIQNTFRFKDECVRHKVLDIVGDLGLLGFDLSARVIGIRSGHSLNHKLVQEIKRQRKVNHE